MSRGIPELFRSREASDPVLPQVKSFYESNPFPDYEGFDDVASLIRKARSGVFAEKLDEEIPFGARVLECGCGTGQLTNFLAIAHRSVIGTDISLSSLRLAEEFRARHDLERAFFLQMNLFAPVFPAESFDVVLCNGVLHHTYAPRKGFATLSRLVRPGGYLIVGLYHRFGRLATDLRRVLFRMTGPRLAFLDPRLRDGKLGKKRRSAWFADQYQNPHESKHTISSVLRWVEELELEFVKSLPKTRLLEDLEPEEELFSPEVPAPLWERALKELSMTFQMDPEGGFFTMIVRKPK